MIATISVIGALQKQTISVQWNCNGKCTKSEKYEGVNPPFLSAICVLAMTYKSSLITWEICMHIAKNNMINIFLKLLKYII